eukprot:TRINITY_DN20215_c0_g1_i1.p1 TRINITY_DN20215_c0_g1~~TRINITY_DN20215_c0_g1_i1.p1  ORF type:complete len:281 (+),score=27.66 TRINITY_DN20215_c0_g1_i1:52-843(+)
MPDLDVGQGSVVIKIPSRLIPQFSIAVALVTILGSVMSCFYHKHDFGGTYWPYISDTAKEMPQAGFFSYGMSLTSLMIFITVLIHHGKLKLNLYALSGQESDGAGFKRAKMARFMGCFAAPNLGLLACFDTSRSPGLHMLFVVLFFIPCLIYFMCIISVYRMMVAKLHKRRKEGCPRIKRLSYVSLETSLRWKTRIGAAFTLFFFLYLPLGMYLVTDWYVYSNDVIVHSFRAVCQHITVACIILFFGSMYFDFGDLVFRIVQT